MKKSDPIEVKKDENEIHLTMPAHYLGKEKRNFGIVRFCVALIRTGLIVFIICNLISLSNLRLCASIAFFLAIFRLHGEEKEDFLGVRFCFGIIWIGSIAFMAYLVTSESNPKTDIGFVVFMSTVLTIFSVPGFLLFFSGFYLLYGKVRLSISPVQLKVRKSLWEIGFSRCFDSFAVQKIEPVVMRETSAISISSGERSIRFTCGLDLKDTLDLIKSIEEYLSYLHNRPRTPNEFSSKIVVEQENSRLSISIYGPQWWSVWNSLIFPLIFTGVLSVFVVPLIIAGEFLVNKFMLLMLWMSPIWIICVYSLFVGFFFLCGRTVVRMHGRDCVLRKSILGIGLSRSLFQAKNCRLENLSSGALEEFIKGQVILIQGDGKAIKFGSGLDDGERLKLCNLINERILYDLACERDNSRTIPD